MANSTTNLDLISTAQAQKEVTANALFDAASPGSYFGRRASTTVSLTWGYYGAVLMVSGTPTRIANGQITLAASVVTYIEATTAGVVSGNTTGWTSGSIPLYKVTTGPSGVTAYEDFRCMAFAVKP